jgi:two-component system LytT family response regulator
MDPESVQSWQSNVPEMPSIVPTSLRVLIVDDERPARDKLKILLSQELDVKVISECDNGAAALAALNELKPDLLLLDIQLPDTDGFSLLKALPREKLPFVIFTTAYDQYAIKAFDAHALDYLLKPFDHERLKEALHRARLAIRTQNDRMLRDRVR